MNGRIFREKKIKVLPGLHYQAVVDKNLFVFTSAGLLKLNPSTMAMTV